MTDEINVAEYLESLSKLAGFKFFNRSFEDFNRFKAGKLDGNHTDLEFLASMGSSLHPFPDPELFLNETPAAIQNQAAHYVKRKLPEMKIDAEKYRQKVIDDYVAVVNKGIEAGSAQGRKELGEKIGKEHLEEAFEAAILPQIYGMLGHQLSELAVSEDYLKSEGADKELVQALKELKGLKESGQDEAKAKVVENMKREYGFTDHIGTFRLDWNSKKEKLMSMYQRLIGKKVLKKTDKGAYEIDKDVLAKVFGSYEGIIDMAPAALQSYQRE